MDNLRSPSGVIRCALFNSKDAFPGNLKKALAGVNLDAAGHRRVCEFPHVVAGVYAVAVFHDENANGKFDLKFYGMPKEGYGASNNPKPRIGPPRYTDARFDHGNRDTALTVNLFYW